MNPSQSQKGVKKRPPGKTAKPTGESSTNRPAPRNNPEAESLTEEEHFDLRHKERVLALYDQRIPKDESSEEFLRQIRVRDSHIEELNNNILQLTGTLKSSETENIHEKDKTIKDLREDKLRLQKDMKALEEESKAMMEKLTEAEANFDTERKDLETLNEALTEENDALKTQLKSRGDQLVSAKDDVAQLSNIVENMTKLNSELNEKTMSLNQELEKTNKENYQSNVKGQQVEEFEKALNEANGENLKLQKKIHKLSEETQKAVRLVQVIGTTEEMLGSTIEQLSTFTNEEIMDVANKLADHKVYLHRVAKEEGILKLEDPKTLKLKIMDLDSELRTLRSDNERLMAVDKTHADRIEELSNDMDKFKAEQMSYSDKLKQKLSATLEANERFRVRCHRLEEENESQITELQRKSTEQTHSKTRENGLETKLRLVMKSEEELKKSLRDLKIELHQSQIEHTNYEAQLALRDKKMKETNAALRSTNDEIWKRDNEILKRETQKLKLVEEVNNLRSSLSNSQNKYKSKVNEETLRLNKQLDAKDKELTALKRTINDTEHMQTTSSATVETNPTAFRLEEASQHLKLIGIRISTSESEGDDGRVANKLRERAGEMIQQLDRDMEGQKLLTLSEQELTRTPGLRQFMRGDGPFSVKEILEKFRQSFA